MKSAKEVLGILIELNKHVTIQQAIDYLNAEDIDYSGTDAEVIAIYLQEKIKRNQPLED
jgi:hypothetical protein